MLPCPAVRVICAQVTAGLYTADILKSITQQLWVCQNITFVCTAQRVFGTCTLARVTCAPTVKVTKPLHINAVMCHNYCLVCSVTQPVPHVNLLLCIWFM